jgi:integrase
MRDLSRRQIAAFDPSTEGTRHEPDAHVFGNDAGDRISEFKLAWRGALQRAGIAGLTFHDLRREHGSRLVEGGVNLLTVSRLLGHKRVSTTDTYLQASQSVAERELAVYHERRQATNGTAAPEADGL